jgi:hypothetical protein
MIEQELIAPLNNETVKSSSSSSACKKRTAGPRIILLLILAAFLGSNLSLNGISSSRKESIRIFGSILVDNLTLHHDDDNSSHHHSEVTSLEVQDMIGPEEDEPANTLSIVCQLSGEFGNNIGKFVHAYVLWRKLTQARATPTRHQSFQRSNTTDNKNATTLPFNYRIILRHQLRGKWVRGRDDARLCFPSSLGRFDFELGNGPDFDARLAQQTQRQWMEQFQGVNIDPKHVQGALDNFTRITTAQRLIDGANFARLKNKSNSSIHSLVSLPFLLSSTMAGPPNFAEFVDDYYHGIRRLLQFDEQACCALKPDPDESVFVSESTGTTAKGELAYFIHIWLIMSHSLTYILHSITAIF